MKERVLEIDILKGMAIFLVVLGHIMHAVYGEHNIIYNICYSFHTPLLMFVSGWLINLSKVLDKEWLINRMKRLMIPYFIWSIIRLIARKGITNFGLNFFRYMFLEPFFWFLITLFIFNVLLFVYCKIKSKYMYYIVIFLGWGVLTILYYLFGSDVLFNVFVMYPYFFGGILYKDLNMNFRSVRCYWVIYVLYPLSVLIYRYDSTEAAQLAQQLAIHFGNEKFLTVLIWGFSKFVIGFIGIMFATLIVTNMVNCNNIMVNGIKKCFTVLGMYTLPIYLLHDNFYVTCFTNRWLNAVVSLIVTLGLSVIVAYVTKKNNRIYKLLFG